MFAIAEIAGKQHLVKKGDVVTVEKLKDAEEGAKLKADHVLLKAEGEKVEIGAPYLDNASVEFTVKAHIKGDKIRVYKKKAKKRYEKRQGHRQQYSEVEITAVK